VTQHPGYVSRDHSQDYPQWIAECPRCDWATRPTVLQGLAAQWLKDHQTEATEGETPS
jgi:hypothetical protein